MLIHWELPLKSVQFFPLWTNFQKIKTNMYKVFSHIKLELVEIQNTFEHFSPSHLRINSHLRFHPPKRPFLTGGMFLLNEIVNFWFWKTKKFLVRILNQAGMLANFRPILWHSRPSNHNWNFKNIAFLAILEQIWELFFQNEIFA